MGGTSGRDGNKGEAVERLWAALLDGSLTPGLLGDLRRRYEETPGGARFPQIAAWLGALESRFPLPIASAERTPPNVNGDVDARQPDGSIIKFEVKAQVKKPAFKEITQSDWVRDQTDLLSWLVTHDRGVRQHFAAVGAAELARVPLDPAWSEAHLHLADLAGVTNVHARINAGIRTPRMLKPFIERKWFLHVTGEGARLCQFTEIAPIRHLLGGDAPTWQVKSNRKGQALLSLQSAGDVTWFTYHLYASEGGDLMGRHKMHEAAFSGVTWI